MASTSPFKSFVSNYAHAMHIAYQDAKRYLSPVDKVILGLATGAVSAITLGLATKPAYTYLVGKLKKGSADYVKHEEFLKKRLDKAHLGVAAKIDTSVREHEVEKEENDTLYIDGAEKSKAEIIAILEKAKKGSAAIRKVEIVASTHATSEILAHLPENLESLTLTGCDHITDRGIAFLEKQTALKSLKIAGLDLLTDKSLGVIGKLSQIEELDLGGCTRFTDEGVKKLSALKIKRLDLCDSKKITDAAIQSLVGSKDSLESLNLKRTAVHSIDQWTEEFPHIKQLLLEGEFTTIDLHGMTNLSYLDLSFCTVPEGKKLDIILPRGGAGLKKLILCEEDEKKLSTETKETLNDLEVSKKDGLAVFTKPPRKKSPPPIPSEAKIEPQAPFNVEQLNKQTSSEFEEFIEEFHQTALKTEQEKTEEKAPLAKEEAIPQELKLFDLKAKELKLPENITDSDLKFLIRFQSLQKLDLTGCTKITSDGLENLKKLPNLKILNLSRCIFSDDDDHWMIISGIRSLKALILDETNISELGLKLISRLPELQTLSLKSVPLLSSNFDVKEAFSKTGFTKLTFLDMRDTKLSNKTLASIKKSLPEKVNLRSGPTAVQKKLEQGTADVVEDLKMASEKITQTVKGGVQNLKKGGKSLIKNTIGIVTKNVNDVVEGFVERMPITSLDLSKYTLSNDVLTLKSSMTDEEMQYFQTVSKKQIGQIKTIVFEKNDDLTDAGLSELKHFPALENIELKALTSVTGSFLMHVKKWENLSLTLSECPKFSPKILSLNTSPLKRVTVTNCKQFELNRSKYSLSEEGVLILKSNITNEDLRSLQTMPKSFLEKIKTVIFKANEEITDEGLFELKHLPQLENIVLKKAVQTTGSFLQQIDHLYKLSLVVSECPRFDPRTLIKRPLKQVLVEQCQMFSDLQQTTKEKLASVNISIR